MMAKRKVKEMTFYPNTPHYDAFRWCVGEGIRVYPRIQKDKSYKLFKEVNGKVVFESNNTYSKKNVDMAIWKFYLYIFDSLK